MRAAERGARLIAAELCRVEATYGNAAVYTSSGWARAGVSTTRQLSSSAYGGRLTLETAYATGLASSRAGYEPIATSKAASWTQAYRACCFPRPSDRISAQTEGYLIPTVQVPVPLTVALLMAVIKQLLPAELHAFMQQLAAWQ